MAEDEQEKPEDDKAEPVHAVLEAVAPEAPPEPEPVAAPEPVKEPPAPSNKLHEWGAAVTIMVLLSGILWVFLSFLRSAGQ